MADWLTYAQAGEKLGMSAEAVRQRARRLRWRTQPANDGKALVLLPDDLTIKPRPPVRPRVQTDGQLPEIARLSELLERADKRVDDANGRADAAQARADAAEARADRAEARVDRAEQALTAERTRADVLRDRLYAAERGERQAQEAAEVLRQTEATRKARGLWQRLSAAVRGD